jgi:cytochrome c-type biogenesis protein
MTSQSQQPDPATPTVTFCRGDFPPMEHVKTDPSSNRLRLSVQWIIRLFAGLLVIGGIGLLLWQNMPHLEHWVSLNEQSFAHWLQARPHDGFLLPLAFLGGLVSSLSPCILALLPLNLSYIGSADIRSKPQAFLHSLAFVLGVVLVLSLFGLFSGFAGAVIVDYKGYVHMAVGLLSVLLAVAMLSPFQWQLPSVIKKMPAGAGPFLVGATFALVSSPCASPVLLTLLLAAGASGNPVIGALTMSAYALGYTMILFIGSLAAGFAQQVGSLKHHAVLMTRISSALLVVVGLYYLLSGVTWFLP